MPRCELCGKSIAGTSYLAGIKEMPSKEDSRIGYILAKLTPKSHVVKPICGNCATEVKDSIERMRK